MTSSECAEAERVVQTVSRGAAETTFSKRNAWADLSPNLGRSQDPFRAIVGRLHAVMVQEGR